VKAKATTVAEYLKSLPLGPRADVEAVLKVVRKHMPKGYEEALAWGMISWQVPLSVYPDTYNQQPLQYAALASQKNHRALYLCSVYGSETARKKLVDGFKAAGKKLDLGKSCVRFKSVDDLPLDVIGEAVAAVPMKDFVAFAKKVRAR
jgi:hypothetical protein